MNAEGRRSREAVRNSIRTYGVKVMDPASWPLKKTKETESHESISRFSEKSLHSHYEIEEGCCKNFLHRVPYATLLATVICVLGILIVATAGQRSAVLTKAMINDVMKLESDLIKFGDIAFLALLVTTGIVALMILIIGILATGDTRALVYNAWKARIGGRMCCAFLMIITFLLFLVWLFMIWLLAIFYFFVAVSQLQCDIYASGGGNKNCLSLPMLNLFFPGNKDDIEICEKHDIKRFCKDFVEKARASYVMDNFGALLIIIALVQFLICLAANYARIRCQAKFQELQELHHLEVDLNSSKDRF